MTELQDSDHLVGLRRYTVLLIAVWTLVVIISSAWRLYEERGDRMTIIKNVARSHVEKDLLLREWNIRHGFVYAPVTPENQPNPYLNLPERDIVTPSGQVFTAINSSLMIRQIYELAAKKSEFKGHLTSLQPLRPQNAPDPWEQQALEQLLHGAPEVSGITEIAQQPYFRLMQPLVAGERCLTCHQNLQVGQLAGGLSVALPLATFTAAGHRTTRNVLLAHGFLWLVGLLGIVFASRQLHQKIKEQQSMENALRQSEKNYRLLVQNIPALVYRGYADGRVDFVDAKVAEVTGYTQEDFSSGRITWPEIILPEDRAASKKIFLEALKGDGAYRREYRIRRQNGEVLWLAEQSQIVLNEQGRIDFVSGVVFDISLQKEMERSLKESERFWKSVLEAVGVGVMVINQQNGQITEVNPQAASMVGLQRDQIIGRPRQDFFLCPQQDDARAVGRAARAEGKLRCADGSLLPIWKTAAPIRIDQIDYVLISFVDLTDQRRAEMALTAANQELQTAFAALEKTNKEINLIGKMVELLQLCETPEEAYPIISQFGTELFPDCGGGIYLLNPSNNLLALSAQWGELQASESIFTPKECWALRQGRPYASGTSPDKLIHPRCQHLDKKMSGDYFCVPLNAQNEILGLLYLEKITSADSEDAAAPGLSETQQNLARTLAEHISLSLANLKLRETLRHQAIRDPLTGLFNRRYLTETLEREIARAQRRNLGVGVIMLDVDHFKRFNDTYGHEAGDHLLAVLGRYLQSSIRAEDIACRYGGEEFTLILPEITAETLMARAEQIRAGARNLEVYYHGKLLGEITISMGVSYYPQHGQDSATLLQAADGALYQAKQSGRNRVVMAGGAWQTKALPSQAA